ncbi:MAG: protein kinase [Myxococcota bacterium]
MGELLDRFELVRKIATGGMADVWLARQWGDGGFVREVVLKRLHGHLAEQDGPRGDFENEAWLLATLSHPGIPRIHDFRREPDGRWYIAMERIPGPTLREVMDAGGPLPAEQAVAIVAGLADVLDEIHEHRDPETGEHLGIVHGDLTPANVILRRDGRVALLDFGIAGTAAYRHARGAEGASAGMRGTFGYLSPEAVRGGGLVDHRADLFVAGVLLYELLTGAPPFPKDGVAFVNAVVEDEARPPREHREQLPPALDLLVLELLEKAPTQRPASAGELRDRLRAIDHAGRDALRRAVDALLPASDVPASPPAVRPPRFGGSVPPPPPSPVSTPSAQVLFSSFPEAPEPDPTWSDDPALVPRADAIGSEATLEPERDEVLGVELAPDDVPLADAIGSEADLEPEGPEPAAPEHLVHDARPSEAPYGPDQLPAALREPELELELVAMPASSPPPPPEAPSSRPPAPVASEPPPMPDPGDVSADDAIPLDLSDAELVAAPGGDLSAAEADDLLRDLDALAEGELEGELGLSSDIPMDAPRFPVPSKPPPPPPAALSVRPPPSRPPSVPPEGEAPQSSGT